MAYLGYSHFFISNGIFILFFLLDMVSLLFLGLLNELGNYKNIPDRWVLLVRTFWSKQQTEPVWFDKTASFLTLFLSPRSRSLAMVTMHARAIAWLSRPSVATAAARVPNYSPLSALQAYPLRFVPRIRFCPILTLIKTRVLFCHGCAAEL
jgi:hypothetical protein